MDVSIPRVLTRGGGFLFSIVGKVGSHTLFRSPANSVTSNSGNKSRDQIWINLKGLKNVDFGGKTLQECLVQAQIGVIPNVLKDQDETGCVGAQRNVNW